MFGYIYKTTNLIDGKFYVGKHIATKFEPEKYIGSGKILKQAIAKYGIENFKTELLDTAEDAGELCKKEQQWIIALDAKNNKVAYNIADGGDGGALCQGYKWYNDGSINYYFPPDVEPPADLVPGRINMSTDNKDTVWIKKGNQQKHIKKSLLADYLSQGWETGMLDRGEEWRAKATAAAKAALPKALQAAKDFYKNHPHWTNQTSFKPGHQTHNKGKISVTNGITNKYLNNIEEVNDFLQANPDWWKGSVPRHKEQRTEMLESLKQNESFTYTKLTPEEMASRGILGRLVGPCADLINATRNGRKYTEQLWENVFNDDIVKEKIANKCLFGELGHPADREEVDPEKIAIALNEVPKKNTEGQLIACFDILNTPCGKILKTLCDYGTTIGISSRGSGDVMPDNSVDPDTYFFECFDAVIVPAVKSARLAYMTEGYDKKQASLRKALKESLNEANEEDKLVMKDTLDNLDIKLDEEEPITEKKAPFIPELDPNKIPLIEDAEEAEGEIPAVEADIEPVVEPVAEEEVVETEAPAEDTQISVEDVAEVIQETAAEVADAIQEITEPTEEQADEIKEKVDEIVVNKVEETFPEIEAELVEPDAETETNEENIDNADIDEPEEAEPEEAPADETAIDDGEEDAKLFDSLKEAIRQKATLEDQVKSLNKEKTVSDTKVKSLEEELNKYKMAFARVSSVAAKSQSIEKEAKQLQEQLAQRDAKINELTNQIKNSKSLNESLNTANNGKIKLLTEKLDLMQKEFDEEKASLSEQLAKAKQKANDGISIARQYKAKLDETLNKYIESKAEMLGVRAADIKSRLSEKYSIKEIDATCDKMLNESVGFSRLPLGMSGIKITEAKAPRQAVDNLNEYEIADWVLESAGLKK